MSARYFRILLVGAIAWPCACAPTASLRVNAHARLPAPIRVTLAPIRDYPGAPGSGPRMTEALAEKLREAGFILVEHGADAMAFVALVDYSQDKALEQVAYPPPWEESVVVKWASARVGLSARLVDAKTGQVIWIASSSSRPDRFDAALDYTYRLTSEEASDQALSDLVDAVVRGLKGAAAAR